MWRRPPGSKGSRIWHGIQVEPGFSKRAEVSKGNVPFLLPTCLHVKCIFFYNFLWQFYVANKVLLALHFGHQSLFVSWAWAPSLDFHQVQMLFRNIDTSGDGAISKDEFSKLVESPMLQFWMGQLELEYHDPGLGSFWYPPTLHVIFEIYLKGQEYEESAATAYPMNSRCQ